MERQSLITRKTKETDIKLKIILGSIEVSSVDTGVFFLDHMLSSVAKHGRMMIDCKCTGDYHIDDHHSVEDIGICFGKALKEALGDKAGMTRFGSAFIPMDESLTGAVIDLSGRGFFHYEGEKLSGYIKNYAEELTMEFFRALAINAEITLHLIFQYGENRHHIHESLFKSFAVAFRQAYSYDKEIEGIVPSTKGVL